MSIEPPLSIFTDPPPVVDPPVLGRITLGTGTKNVDVYIPPGPVKGDTWTKTYEAPPAEEPELHKKLDALTEAIRILNLNIECLVRIR